MKDKNKMTLDEFKNKHYGPKGTKRREELDKGLFGVEIFFQVVNIILKCFNPFSGNGKRSIRIVVLKGFFYLDVACFLQFFNLYAQVTRCSLSLILDEVKVSFLHRHQYGYNR